jgi:hypothetical protein
MNAATAPTTKTAACLVSFQGYDWQNTFSVKSPTGRTVTVHCDGKWGQMSAELADLINAYQYADVKALPWSSRPVHPHAISYALMAEIRQLAG